MQIKGGIEQLSVNLIINGKDQFKNTCAIVEPSNIQSKNKEEIIEKQIYRILGSDWQVIYTTKILSTERGEGLLVALKEKTVPDPVFVEWQELPKALRKQPRAVLHSRKLVSLPTYPDISYIKETLEPGLLISINELLEENKVDQTIKDLIIVGWLTNLWLT